MLIRTPECKFALPLLAEDALTAILRSITKDLGTTYPLPQGMVCEVSVFFEMASVFILIHAMLRDR